MADREVQFKSIIQIYVSFAPFCLQFRWKIWFISAGFWFKLQAVMCKVWPEDGLTLLLLLHSHLLNTSTRSTQVEKECVTIVNVSKSTSIACTKNTNWVTSPKLKIQGPALHEFGKLVLILSTPVQHRAHAKWLQTEGWTTEAARIQPSLGWLARG